MQMVNVLEIFEIRTHKPQIYRDLDIKTLNTSSDLYHGYHKSLFCVYITQ